MKALRNSCVVVAFLFCGCALSDNKKDELATDVASRYAATAEDRGRALTPEEVAAIVRQATEELQSDSWANTIGIIIGGVLLATGGAWGGRRLQRKPA